MTRAAAEPFVFSACVELRQALDQHAHDARELMERLEAAPDDSVFFHVHGYFLRHRPFTTAYGNDFARWLAVEWSDLALAERLAVVDPFQFETLAELREELVTIIHGQLRDAGPARRVEFEHAFHFQQSRVVPVPLGPRATTLCRVPAGSGRRRRERHPSPHGGGARPLRPARGRLRRLAPGGPRAVGARGGDRAHRSLPHDAGAGARPPARARRPRAGGRGGREGSAGERYRPLPGGGAAERRGHHS